MWFRHRHDGDDRFTDAAKGNVDKWVARRYDIAGSPAFVVTGGYTEYRDVVLDRLRACFPDADIADGAASGEPVVITRHRVNDAAVARWYYVIGGDGAYHEEYRRDAIDDGTFYRYHTQMGTIPWSRKWMYWASLAIGVIAVSVTLEHSWANQYAMSGFDWLFLPGTVFLGVGLGVLFHRGRGIILDIVNDHGETFTDRFAERRWFFSPSPLECLKGDSMRHDDVPLVTRSTGFVRSATGGTATSYSNIELAHTFDCSSGYASPGALTTNSAVATGRLAVYSPPAPADLESALSALLPGGIDGNMREAVASLSPTDAGGLYAAIKRLATAPDQTGGETGGTAGDAPTPATSETGNPVTVAGSPANAIRSIGTPVRG